MSSLVQIIPQGFGARLRSERGRLGLTQTQFAELAGVQRLAQSQYESETRAPNVRYLSAIGAAGVNLHFLMFGGVASHEHALSPADARTVEMRAFELIEDVANLKFGGKMSADARFVLFEVIRGRLADAIRQGVDADLSAIEPLFSERQA